MKMTVVLDAGHGGKDSGAVGPSGLKEKDVALRVVLLLGAILTKAGIDVFYTRKDDRFLELSQRARMANEFGADRFLSVHCNSADNRTATGFEIYTTPGETKADGFATEVFKAFGVKFPTRTRRMDASDGDPDKEANFAVLRLTNMPAALMELEFISSLTGEEFLSDPVMQTHCAEALADGILADLGLQVPATPAPAEAGTKQRLLAIAAEITSIAHAS